MGYKAEQFKAMRARIKHVILTNPGITNEQLRARFGNKSGMFQDIRKEVDQPCPRSEYITVDELKNAKCVEPNMEERDRFGRSW